MLDIMTRTLVLMCMALVAVLVSVESSSLPSSPSSQSESGNLNRTTTTWNQPLRIRYRTAINDEPIVPHIVKRMLQYSTDIAGFESEFPSDLESYEISPKARECTTLEKLLHNVLDMKCVDATLPPVIPLHPTPSGPSSLTELMKSSSNPSVTPSLYLTDIPTTIPSVFPSILPSIQPSFLPSELPSAQPTGSPSVLPSTIPTFLPTTLPSTAPSTSHNPSGFPSVLPTVVASTQPTTLPSVVPSTSQHPSGVPSDAPSGRPSASAAPTTDRPSGYPTDAPSPTPTAAPTTLFSARPTNVPTTVPSSVPSAAPTLFPQNRCLFTVPLTPATDCADRLSSDDSGRDGERCLAADEFLCSPNHRYRFGLTLDFQLCLCDAHDSDRKIWCAENCCGQKNDDDKDYNNNDNNNNNSNDDNNREVLDSIASGTTTVTEMIDNSQLGPDDDELAAVITQFLSGSVDTLTHSADTLSTLAGAAPWKPYVAFRKNGCLVAYNDNVGFGRRSLWHATRDDPFGPRWRDVTMLQVVDDGNVRIVDTADETDVYWQTSDLDPYEPYFAPTGHPTVSDPPSLTPTMSSQPTVSDPPSPAPTLGETPAPTKKKSFVPGKLVDHPELGMRLSKGLTARIVGQIEKRVKYADGTKSEARVHLQPDAAGCFSQPDGGWIYVSNSEVGGGRGDPGGGVGAFTFKKNGDLVDYKMLQTETLMNCGGGVTPWGTWFTGEEWDQDPKGLVWEVEPTGKRKPRATKFGEGKFESAICDDREMTKLACFATADHETEGALRRYKPRKSVLADAIASGDYSEVMHSSLGTMTYLVLDKPFKGKFQWSSDKAAGDKSAQQWFPNTEGVDHHEGRLYFVTKMKKLLYILDLDAKTYTATSTDTGPFDAQPDQIAHLIGDDPNGSSYLYFLEDGGAAPGVFGRNLEKGKYFTILEKIQDEIDGGEETTGLAFCDDSMRMMFAFQETGNIIEVMREDGFPFYGATANVKYHDSMNTRGDRARASTSGDMLLSN